MKKSRQPIRMLVIIAVITAAGIGLFKHFYINDFRVVSPGVLYVSGQPGGMDYFRLLYRYHLATIINIRPASEHREHNWHNEEIIWTKNNGVNYIELPIEKTDYFPDRQAQEKFLAIMADKANIPVLLHGGRNDKRVAMLVAAWLRESERYDVNAILKEVKKIIDDRELTEEELKFIHSLSDANER